MHYSLRSGLTALWGLILLISLSIGLILISLFREGIGAQVQQAASRAELACETIRERYASVFDGRREPAAAPNALTARDLTLILDLTLAGFEGMEGGVWHPAKGFTGYAFPTHEGTAPKRDVPEAERQSIVDLARKVSAQADSATLRYTGGRESLVIHACPLRDPAQSVAWTMIRVPTGGGAAYTRLLIGLATLFGFALVSGAWLLFLLQRWSKRVHALEQAIAGSPPDQLPQLPASGEQEMDRIIAALNDLSRRLAAAQDESLKLGTRLAQADRLAAMGRLAAVLAHEIRNPLAAMRLKAENAMAKSPQPQQEALNAVLQQVQRIDGLIQRLMAVVQPLDLKPAPVALRSWLKDRVSFFQEQADQRGVALYTDAPDLRPVFDATSVGRALENLLLNALQQTPTGGRIDVTAGREENRLLFCVEDTGPGVLASERERIFEPFMTTRADGTGLGLAIVREIVETHGGTVRCEGGSHGARFVMELPWQTS